MFYTNPTPGVGDSGNVLYFFTSRLFLFVCETLLETTEVETSGLVVRSPPEDFRGPGESDGTPHYCLHDSEGLGVLRRSGRRRVRRGTVVEWTDEECEGGTKRQTYSDEVK